MVWNGPMNDQRSPKPIFERLVEVLRRHIAVLNQAECFRQQHGLETVENEPIDLAPDDDGDLPDRLVDCFGLLNGCRRGPRRGNEAPPAG